MARQLLDVRTWRLPFALFQGMYRLTGNFLWVSTLAWMMFYLIVLALEVPDAGSMDTPTLANALFLPLWPGCVVVAAGAKLVEQRNLQ